MGVHTFQYLSICSGDGGLDLGVHLAIRPARTVCYVEREASAIQVLAARMEDGFLDKAPVWTDLRTFDGRPWRGKLHCVVGGYPCQPWSHVGKRLGSEDPRHLWPSIARVLRDSAPPYCYFENVEGHLSLGFPEVRAELRGMGYRVEAGLFSAAEVDGSHVRKRLFILGAKEEVLADPEGLRGPQDERLQSDGVLPGLGFYVEGHGDEEIPAFPPKPDQIEEWEKMLLEKPELEPAFRDVADEPAARLAERGGTGRINQLRLLGNSVVPVVAAYAFVVLLGRLIKG